METVIKNWKDTSGHLLFPLTTKPYILAFSTFYSLASNESRVVNLYCFSREFVSLFKRLRNLKYLADFFLVFYCSFSSYCY